MTFSIPVSGIRSHTLNSTVDWPVNPKVSPGTGPPRLYHYFHSTQHQRSSSLGRRGDNIPETSPIQQQLMSQHLKSYIPAMQTSLPFPNIRNLKEALWVHQGAQQSLLLGGKCPWGRARPLPLQRAVTGTKPLCLCAQLHPQHTCQSPSFNKRSGSWGRAPNRAATAPPELLGRTKVKQYPPLKASADPRLTREPLKSPNTLSSNPKGLLVPHLPQKVEYILRWGRTPD